MLLKPPQVTLDVNAFKALASETRLDILRKLDGKKMGLNELSEATNLHKATLHEHLNKLVEAGLVTKIERDGYKWVYYKLSWQGANLLHPENSRIVVMFGISLAFLAAFAGGLLYMLRDALHQSEPLLQSTMDEGGGAYDPWLLSLTVACLILFAVFLSLSTWRYRKNRAPRV
ncbi:MAG: ArsR/SmtB family transcription factor, partial [Thermoplasmatota archaeon]